jgi:hypothetical protein
MYVTMPPSLLRVSPCSDQDVHLPFETYHVQHLTSNCVGEFEPVWLGVGHAS